MPWTPAPGAVDDEHHRDCVLVDFDRRAFLHHRILGADVARLRLLLRRRRFRLRVGRCIRIAERPIARRARIRLRQHANGQQVAQRLETLAGEGATIAQIVEATAWQSHTVRGFFAGALKKKLGLNVTSEKVEGEERVYRLP